MLIHSCNLCDCESHLEQGFFCWAWLTFWAWQLSVGGCLVHCKSFGSISGLRILDICSMTPPPEVTIKNVSRNWPIYPPHFLQDYIRDETVHFHQEAHRCLCLFGNDLQQSWLSVAWIPQDSLHVDVNQNGVWGSVYLRCALGVGSARTVNLTCTCFQPMFVIRCRAQWCGCFPSGRAPVLPLSPTLVPSALYQRVRLL